MSRANRSREIGKTATGISGFDDIAEGGLPEGTLTLVSGTAGSAKTIFGMQFLASGITEFEDNAVFVTFEERPAQMRRHMLSLGWDIETWEEQGRWAFVDASPFVDVEQVEAGSFNLEALVARIEFAVKSVGAKRVVMDSLGTMFTQIQDAQLLRSELFRIIQSLQGLNVTSILTAERSFDKDDLGRYGVEEFVADNVVILRHALESDKRRRTIEILKFRGTTYRDGEYPFTVLKNKGIIVIPLTSSDLRQKTSSERTTTGNSDLDEMCGGGLLRSSVILVSGATGTGKTLTTTQFIGAGGMLKEKCLLFAFEESRDQIFRNAASWGYDFEAMEKEGYLKVVCRYPESAGLNDHLVKMRMEVEEFAPQRVAVDSLSAIERIATPKAFRELVISLTSFLKEKQTLAVFTSTTSALLGGASITDANISTITDTIVLLRYIELMGEMRRGVMILKMRGSPHNKEIREFVITEDGMTVGKAFRNVSGILSGNASVLATDNEMSRMKSLFTDGDGAS